jgi:hypothetical protein
LAGLIGLAIAVTKRERTVSEILFISFRGTR